MVKWHDDDDFWIKMAPVMFSPTRLEATREEVDTILALIGIQSGGILDMGCGVGRHSIELARRGFQVTGVDRTQVYLQEAGELAEAEGVNVEFLLADMRDFHHKEKYDAALSLFTSFGYFETPAENQQVLHNIYEALKSPGVLVMDMMGKEILARIFLERGWQQVGDYYFLEERTISRDWSWVENRWILIGEDERYEVEISHWVYSAAELKAMLIESGFRDVQVYGDLAGAPYDTNASRLVAVAKK
jgi:SAM-dependent methyltransferase